MTLTGPLGSYDALLFVSVGGPEGPDDVVPFLENVTRGRGIPRERLVEVGAHYTAFGGVSPINGQNREFIAVLCHKCVFIVFRLPAIPGESGRSGGHG